MLRRPTPAAYAFKIDKSHGIEVMVMATVIDFPAVATQMRFWAYLSPQLRERFYIANGQAYLGHYFGDPKRDKPVDSPFDEIDKESRTFANIKLQDMKKGDVYFRIQAACPSEIKKLDYRFPNPGCTCTTPHGRQSISLYTSRHRIIAGGLIRVNNEDLHSGCIRLGVLRSFSRDDRSNQR